MLTKAQLIMELSRNGLSCKFFFAVAVLFTQATRAEAGGPLAFRGGALEFLYSQPNESTNKRFSDLRDSHFDTGTYRSHEFIFRERADLGDGTGFEGRAVGELTYLSAQAKRSYETGKLKLTHQYIGLNAAIGATYFITAQIVPYVELALLLPAFMNEVTISSSSGKAKYKSDYNDGSNFFTSGMNFGAAIGIDYRVFDQLVVKVHFDSWKVGSGKAGGFHVGVGFAY